MQYQLRINWFVDFGEEMTFEGTVNEAMLEWLLINLVGNDKEIRDAVGECTAFWDLLKEWGEAAVRVMSPYGTSTFNAKKVS